jgi:hypothetical protein
MIAQFPTELDKNGCQYLLLGCVVVVAAVGIWGWCDGCGRRGTSESFNPFQKVGLVEFVPTTTTAVVGTVVVCTVDVADVADVVVVAVGIWRDGCGMRRSSGSFSPFQKVVLVEFVTASTAAIVRTVVVVLVVVVIVVNESNAVGGVEIIKSRPLERFEMIPHQEKKSRETNEQGTFP